MAWIAVTCRALHGLPVQTIILDTDKVESMIEGVNFEGKTGDWEITMHSGHTFYIDSASAKTLNKLKEDLNFKT